MLSLRTASQKPGIFNTLLKDSAYDGDRYMTKRSNINDTMRRDSIASGGGITGANSTMMMDTGVDLLSRVQMF